MNNLNSNSHSLLLPLFIFQIPGGCCGSTKKRTIVGGWAWAWWLVTDVQRLSLEVMTLNPMCEGVETAQGVPLTVTGVAQCKIMKVCSRYAYGVFVHFASVQYILLCRLVLWCHLTGQFKNVQPIYNKRRHISLSTAHVRFIYCYN